jgi:hypothetical protein
VESRKLTHLDDPIVVGVLEKIKSRSDAGMNKYGVPMSRPDLTTIEWLQHAQEEALDFAVYLEKLKQEACVLSRDDMVLLISFINSVEAIHGLSEIINFKEEITSVRQKLQDALNLG